MRHFLVAASAGLALSLAAHATTFCSVRLSRHASWIIIVLFIGAWLVCCAAFEASNRLSAMATKSKGAHAGEGSFLPCGTPRWVKRVFAALGVYFVVCFISSAYLGGADGGSFPVWDVGGREVLISRGRFIRTLTPAEFDKLRNLFLRWYCVFCLMLYSFATIHLVAGCRARNRASVVSEEPELI